MKMKIDKTDTGCCAVDCGYKKNKYCSLYNSELYGSEDNPTRCGDCFSESEKGLNNKLVNIWNEEFPENKVDSIGELKVIR